MGTYRMFVLDESNWLIGGHIIAAESDSEALETAVRMGEGATHDPWDRTAPSAGPRNTCAAKRSARALARSAGRLELPPGAVF